MWVQGVCGSLYSIQQTYKREQSWTWFLEVKGVEWYIAYSRICASYVTKERYTLRYSEYVQGVCSGMGAAKPEGASLHKKDMLAREGS
jgi:hypothetical protein